MFAVYFYTTAFMGVSYLPHVLTRLITMILFSVAILVHRRALGDVRDSGIASIISFSVLLSQELSLYVNYKAKAKLFIENKVNLKQQEQLANLLNSVPDNVIICTKSSEKQVPIPLYGNARVNNFFGQSVVESHDKRGVLRAVKNPYEKK